MMYKNIIIAIDGYSSCGKSTIAKALAEKLQFIYIDTGAMYRAVTLYFIRKKIDIKDEIAIEKALNNIHINFEYSDERTFVFLNDEDGYVDNWARYIYDINNEFHNWKK